jgi:hypothetical protein
MISSDGGDVTSSDDGDVTSFNDGDVTSSDDGDIISSDDGGIISSDGGDDDGDLTCEVKADFMSMRLIALSSAMLQSF